MANKIQLRRGTKAKLPALSLGEMGLCTDTHEMYVGNSGNIRVSNRRTATKVIGNSNAGYNAGDVDYLVSGTSNAATIIQNAINALPSTGGKIIFLDGTYTISSAISISKDVIFEGMGDGTQFNVSGSLATCSSAVNIVFRDMKITANTISKNLYKGGGSDSVLLDNVNLTMTATGTHSLSTTDAYAAFIGCGMFKASASKIDLTTSCNAGTQSCFSIVDTGKASEDCNVSYFNDCDIKLNGKNGNAHVSRYGCRISNSKLHFISSTNSYVSVDSGEIANMGFGFLTTCEIELDGTSNHFGFSGSVIGSTIRNLRSSGTSVGGAIIGCKLCGDKRPTVEDTGHSFGNF